MIYDVNFFIAKFSAIPEHSWMNGSWKDGDRCCAGGHCGMRNNNLGVETPEYKSLEDLLSQNLSLTHRWQTNAIGFAFVPLINDGDSNEYQQETPKQRILAALYDIKNMQEKAENPEPAPIKEVIRYVSVPASITEQTKELFTEAKYN